MAERPSSIVWDKASNKDLQRYASQANSKLEELSISDEVLQCTDPLCQKHKPVLDSYCHAICDCLIQSAKDCIPTTTARKRVAGWNASACLLKRQASFWHQLWVRCGLPSTGNQTES